MKKGLVKKSLMLIAPLIWLLLLCGSQMRVEAQQDTIKPKLVLNRAEIDLCNSNIGRDFVLTIDLGKTIVQTDSLFIAEIIFLYKREKMLIDGYLTMGTLFEQFDPTYFYFKTFPANVSGEYDTVMMQGMRLFTAVGGHTRLVNFTGRLLGDITECECFDFIIESIFLGNDFKIPYISQYPDTTELCLINRNLPDRKISIKGFEDSYTIDSLEDTLRLDFFVEVANKKNLKSFNIELNINNEFFDDVEIANIYTDNIILVRTDTNCIIKIDNIDTTNINSAKILTAELIRKRNEEANVIIHFEINEINECACSMNGDAKSVEINLPEKVSIVGELNEGITILESGDMILLKSNDEITYFKLIDLYGVEINYGIERIGDKEVLFDKIKLAKGVYFIKVITNNTSQLQNINLIIN